MAILINSFTEDFESGQYDFNTHAWNISEQVRNKKALALDQGSTLSIAFSFSLSTKRFI
jgi:hypothetical protein